MDRAFLLIGFVFSFLFIVAGPSDGAVYVWAPLIGEPACLVRNLGGFRATGHCKWFWGMGLRSFGFLCVSKIVPTDFIRNWVEGGW